MGLQVVAEVHFDWAHGPGGEAAEVQALGQLHGAGWRMWRREDNHQGMSSYRTFMQGKGSCCFDVAWVHV